MTSAVGLIPAAFNFKKLCFSTFSQEIDTDMVNSIKVSLLSTFSGVIFLTQLIVFWLTGWRGERTRVNSNLDGA